MLEGMDAQQKLESAFDKGKCFKLYEQPRTAKTDLTAESIISLCWAHILLDAVHFLNLFIDNHICLSKVR